MKQYNNEKAIISLTSYPLRIKYVSKSIYNILQQCPGFHIVLVLSEEEFPNKEQDLPIDLCTMIENDLIEVIFASVNLKPHNKYFYTMSKYRIVPIITCDDDQLYHKNFARLLYESYIKNTNVVHACRCHKIVKSMGHIAKYENWKHDITSLLEPSFDLFATGVGTCLYPPNILRITANDLRYDTGYALSR